MIHVDSNATRHGVGVVGNTSAGVGFSPGWETPSSPGFPTGTANLGLKARPLVLVPSTRIALGLLVTVGNTNRE
jgi:hypothetical protein